MPGVDASGGRLGVIRPGLTPLAFLLHLPPSLPPFHAEPEPTMSAVEKDGLSVTHACDRTGTPDLRLIHYNDVYHVE